MCKHVKNAQVAVRASCCKRWFDCPQCHEETADHELLKTWELAFACKKCKKCFRKDLRDWDDDTDRHCPHCDNCFVIEAVEGATPRGKLVLEMEDTAGATHERQIDIGKLSDFQQSNIDGFGGK
eukprot:gb/GECH01011517.1/.p1 GENE.gb/GECH01011517.1/~~gb/GECH01011517.1/.p1  ORF type:complete len:124 (+),score=31.09 gb/GECH01011517.1/:1-372(+)